jgi:hypothetical protein
MEDSLSLLFNYNEQKYFFLSKLSCLFFVISLSNFRCRFWVACSPDVPRRLIKRTKKEKENKDTKLQNLKKVDREDLTKRYNKVERITK